MNSSELADELILRLNNLIESEDIRYDVQLLLGEKIACSGAALQHPTLQVDTEGSVPELGFLGLLNGLVGERSGMGYISAVFDDDGELLRFERTHKEKA